LEQAREVGLRVKENRTLLAPVREGVVFVRIPRKEEGRFVWSDAWLEPEAPKRKVVRKDEVFDELRLQRIKRRALNHAGAWEVDFFYSPTPVREGTERPWFPYTLLCVDHDSGLVLHVFLAPHWRYRSEFLTQLLSLIEREGRLPERILVVKTEVDELLGPVFSGLGIRSERVRELGALDEAKASLFEFFADA